MFTQTFDHLVYLIFAPFVFLGLAIVLARIRHSDRSPSAAILFVLLLFLMGWIICSVFVMFAISKSQAYFWMAAAQLCICATTPVWSWFVLSLTGNPVWLHRRVYVAVGTLVVGLWVAVLTNNSHYLFWSEVTFVFSEGMVISQAKPGILFWAYTALVYSIFLFSHVFFVNRLRKQEDSEKKLQWQIFWAGFIPFAANMTHKLKLIPGFDKDFTPVFFGISAVLLNEVLKAQQAKKWKNQGRFVPGLLKNS